MWKVENVSPREAGVVLCRRSGEGLKGRGLRVVSSDPKPRTPSSLGLGVHSLACPTRLNVSGAGEAGPR